MNRKLHACHILSLMNRFNYGSAHRSFQLVWKNGNICMFSLLENPVLKDDNYSQRRTFVHQLVPPTYCKRLSPEAEVKSLSAFLKIPLLSITYATDSKITNENSQGDEDKYKNSVQQIRESVLPETLLKSKSKNVKAGNVQPKINVSKIKYPLKGLGLGNPIYTDKFETCRNFLESLEIPTDELQFYPDIQEMDRADIIACIDKLKECDIHCVFSLFLIQRIFMEIHLDRTRTSTKVPKANPKQWYKLRNGFYRLSAIACVRNYVELCQLLESPALDTIALFERLAGIGVYDYLSYILTKTKKLRSVGAHPKDILDNLELFKGAGKFNEKIKLYQSFIDVGKGPFPVHLFLTSSLTEFKNKLHIGDELTVISRLLNVKETDFLMCWSFKSLHTKSLVHKLQMCLRAGIPQDELFNNVSLLDRISVDQCHLVTESLRKSGHPGSVYVFKELESNIHHRNNGPTLEEPDWTCEHASNSRVYQTCKVQSRSNTDTSTPLSNGFKGGNSSKRWRLEVFSLIGHLLGLDGTTRQAMFKTEINVDLTRMIDVPRNFDFLLSQGFTKEDLAKVPVVLAHPWEDLARAARDLPRLVRASVSVRDSSRHPHGPLSSPTCPSLFVSSPVDRSTQQPDDLDAAPLSNELSNVLLSDPVTRLNVLQYFLERQTNFSLSHVQAQSMEEFCN